MSMLKNNNMMMLSMVAVVVVVGSLSYAVLMNKQGFPCQCPKCEGKSAGANPSEFPMVGVEEKGMPAFAMILFALVVFSVLAYVVAMVQQRVPYTVGRYGL